MEVGSSNGGMTSSCQLIRHGVNDAPPQVPFMMDHNTNGGRTHEPSPLTGAEDGQMSSSRQSSPMPNSEDPLEEEKSNGPTETVSRREFDRLKTDYGEIKQGVTYLTHHIHRILLALHVPNCTCETCAQMHQKQNEMILQSISDATNGIAATEENGHNKSMESTTGAFSEEACSSPSKITAANLTGMLNGSIDVLGRSPSASSNLYCSENANGSEPLTLNTTAISDFSPDKDAASLLRTLSRSAGFSSPTVKRTRGRPKGSTNANSKYCTAEGKRLVADFAATHGATAAGRRFGIPPSMANYYYRKFYKVPLPKGRPRGRRISAETAAIMQLSPNRARRVDELTASMANGIETTPLRSFDGVTPSTSEVPVMETEVVQNGVEMDVDGNASTIVTTALGVSASPSVLFDNSAHTRSVKTRGRKKQIGDELDRDLCNHLVEVTSKIGRINPEQLLDLSLTYIRGRNPSLLAENGGRVSLKQGWAIKMLRRVNYQLKYGVPFPTTSNSNTQTSVASGVFGNSMVKQERSSPMVVLPEQSVAPLMMPLPSATPPSYGEQNSGDDQPPMLSLQEHLHAPPPISAAAYGAYLV